MDDLCALTPQHIQDKFKELYDYVDSLGFEENIADNIVDKISDGQVYLEMALREKNESKS